jgi:hypothetical protein
MGEEALAGRVVRSYPFGPVDRLEIDPMYFWLQEHEPLARVKLPYGDEGWLRLAVPAEQLEWKTGMAVRGPVALPVEW